MQDQLIQFIKKHNRNYKNKLGPQSRILMERIMTYMQKGKTMYLSGKNQIQTENLTQLPTGNQYMLIDEKVRAKIGELTTFTKREFTAGSRSIRIFSCRKGTEQEDPCEKEIESIRSEEHTSELQSRDSK